MDKIERAVPDMLVHGVSDMEDAVIPSGRPYGGVAIM